MMKHFGTALVCILSLTLPGCMLFSTNVRVLQSLEIGMTKAQVCEVAGNPASARGAIRNKDGKIVEVWTYVLKRPGPYRNNNYSLRFEDGKLDRWGREGDWDQQPDYSQKLIFEDQTGKKQGLQ